MSIPEPAARSSVSHLQRLFVNADVIAERVDLELLGMWPLPKAWRLIASDELKSTRTRSDRNAILWIARAENIELVQAFESIRALEQGNDEGFVMVVLGLEGPSIQHRNLIENQAFAHGFRKHPGYYSVLEYEPCGELTEPLVIPLERIPAAAIRRFNVSGHEKRDGQPEEDMLRQTGDRSDSCLVRYHLASGVVRLGDRVLDAACGVGYGCHVLAKTSLCSSVLGLDGSPAFIDYANLNFASSEGRLAFANGNLGERLRSMANASFDVIVAFGVLEQVDDAERVLEEFWRLLSPGGQLVVSVRNSVLTATDDIANPHQRQRYTLDKIRGHLSHRFIRERLYQQIATGCHRQSLGNQWTPLARVLREIPVDTRIEPDSEWWILVGSKSGGARAIDYDSPSYAGVSPVWTQTAGPKDLIANGVVLAMHCVPESADPRVERFWSLLDRRLREHGYLLILLSTTPVNNDELQVIDIPFQLTQFSQKFRVQPSMGIEVSEQAIHEVVTWYGCSYQQANDSLRVAHAFIRDLLDTLRPSAVLGWQSLNPVTKVLRERSRSAELPYWSSERGWIRNTLMFDLGGPHLLSELDTSLASSRQLERYRPSENLLNALKNRTLQSHTLGRYEAAPRLDRVRMRSKLGIPEDHKVVVLFTHGEPGMNSHSTASIREFHDLSPDRLQAWVDVLSLNLQARGIWLLVQEHPFNVGSDRCIRLPEGPQILTVKENVSSLIDAADAFLFTLATLQFDLVFQDKPLGLLCRSALYHKGDPPYMGDYDSAEEFIDALFDEGSWVSRRERLQARMAFIYENLLLDIEPAVVDESASEWATHLARLRRPVDSLLGERVEQFLGVWGAR